MLLIYKHDRGLRIDLLINVMNVAISRVPIS